jgi:D-sedoheptulose 7-phosphate isomerase
MKPTQDTRTEYLEEYRKQVIQVLLKIVPEDVANLIGLLEAARAGDRQIFVCGNGGSAATASHFATDLGKGASFGRRKRFRVLSLTDNLPWISALANDTDYSTVFVEQLKNYARPGDLLIAFSGSGNSPNVVCATEWGRQNGLVTVGITGRPGGALGRLAEYPVHVESSHMGRIEDAHFFLQHIVCYYFMEKENSQA